MNKYKHSRKPHKPKISEFTDPKTGEFDIQGYDGAMEAYEDELESWGNFEDNNSFYKFDPEEYDDLD